MTGPVALYGEPPEDRVAVLERENATLRTERDRLKALVGRLITGLDDAVAPIEALCSMAGSDDMSGEDAESFAEDREVLEAVRDLLAEAKAEVAR